jgi:hypothetical protein
MPDYETVEVIADIIAHEMALAESRIALHAQNVPPPREAGLFVAIDIIEKTVSANNIRYESRGDDLWQLQTLQVREQISINVLSTDSEAHERNHEIVFALGGTYAQQLQEKYGLHIDRIPSAFTKLDSTDGDGMSAGSGLFARIKAESLTHARTLLYTQTGPNNNGHRLMAAAYAGRAMSTHFSGSNTTSTMHLKDLATITPDPLVTQTVIGTCKSVGPDVYVSIAGVPKVFTSGANDFFDNIYNLLWFKGALEVAGFNALATTSTKIPQTEPGMSVLKGAYRLICEQALANGFIAPGAWNSPELFGDPETLRRNIEERGYYIYSQPVNQQPQADREARKAPLIQMAIKFSGAIHSSNLIVYINR